MSDRVPLSFLLVQNKDEQPPVEPIVPFPAMYLEAPRICTAVLERTCVLASMGDQYDRVTAPHYQVLVDRDVIEWRTKTAGYDGERISPADHRRPGARFRRYTEEGRAESRRKTDEEALRNQREVEEAKEAELRYLRQRASERVGRLTEREDTVNSPQQPATTNPTVVTVISDGTQRLKRCRRCQEERSSSQFPATGIYGGYCVTCAPIEKAERAAARGSKSNAARPAKKFRARGSAAAAPATNSSVGTAYDNVIKLLHKRDSLKGELARVQQQIQEALA